MATEKQIRARLKQRSDGFLNNAKANGNVGFVLFCDLLHFWNVTGDWRPMHSLVSGAVHSDNAQFRKMLAHVLDPAWKWTSKGFARDKEKGFEGGANYVSKHGIIDYHAAEFDTLAASGASFRGWQKAKSEDTRDEAEKSAARKADLAAKTLRLLDKEGMSIDEWANFLRVCKVNEDAKGNAA